jgi:hypothetical protein
VYCNGSDRAARYIVYPDGTLIFTEGSTVHHVFGRVGIRPYPIDNPLCFAKVEVSEQAVLSVENFEQIIYLADKIEVENWGIDYEFVRNGGFRHFISYKGYYGDPHGAFVNEHNELIRDNELMKIVEDIEQLLNNYFEKGFQGSY